VVGLDPLAQYVIYFTFPTSYVPSYDVYADASSSGGLVSAVGSTWQSSTKNVRFALASNSILALPAGNYAEGHGTSDWSCIFHTVYSALQVNWQTGEINTGYFTNAASTTIKGGCNAANYWAPYGTAAGCGFEHRFAHLDITGSNYKFNESFITAGYLAGGTITFSSNNQVLDIMGTGDCGFTVSSSAYAAGGESASTVTGGFYVHIIRSA